MAAESAFSENLESRNRGGGGGGGAATEPKKKLKKRRSIRVSRVASLKPRSKSRFEWLSADLSTESSAAPHYMKSTSSFIAKKESHPLGGTGSEYDDVNSVVSSSCGSSDRAVHPSSIESLDASPVHVEVKSWFGGKKGDFNASSCDSESTTSEISSVNFSRKSLHSPLRTSSSSIRNVRVLVRKSSFKPKKNSTMSSQIPEKSHVDKATYSSIVKDSRFPEHVELEAGETEADRVPVAKVCPYHHCSLHGHTHDPPARERSSQERRRSLKLQTMSKKPRSMTGVKPAAYKGNDIKKHQMSSTREAPIQEVTIVKREPVKAFYSEKGIVLETRWGSYNMETDFSGEVEGGEKSASSAGDREENLTQRGENADSSGSDSSELHKTLFNHADSSHTSDATLNSQPSENVPPEMVRNIDEATEDERVTFPLSDGDSEPKAKVQNPVRDTESPPSSESEVQTPQLEKGGHISMWRLIQSHMASGLEEDDTSKELQGDEERRVEETNADTAKESSDACLEPSHQDVDTENQETDNQDIEIRKLFAIKMVREAIEKILLPEIQDQSSETQSITSDVVEDQETPEKNQQEAPAERFEGGSGNNGSVANPAADQRLLGDAEESMSKQEEKKPQTKWGKKSDKKSPSNWSNLKKWIILQRFVKALEKVRKFNPSKPRNLQLETDPKAEKVNLRHQTVDERRRGEEWMLDYALRQAISELAPTQKKKVELLVKAFETVVPPQEEHNSPTTFPRLKGKMNADAFIARKDDLSPTEAQDMKSHAEENILGKPDDGERSSVLEGDSKTKGREMPLDGNTCPSMDPCLKSDSIINSCKEVPGDAGFQQEATEKHIVADTPGENSEHIAYSTSEQQGPVIVDQEFPPTDLKGPDKENGPRQSQMEKQNYFRMWHMVYQHVASSIATKVGSELLGGEDEEVEYADNLSQKDAANISHEGVEDEYEHKANHLQLSRSDAVKLVQEAVNEILDDASDTQSVTSETSVDQSISRSASLNNKKFNEFESEGGYSLDEEERPKPETVSTQEHEGADPIKPYPRKMKNWSKLKRLMLLKRSIKAMEKARELKLQSKQLLSLPSDPRPEKVDLRQQMIDERKKAEQWMLDYAVQHIVTTLTPARKKRVAMLVEAFEAVVPLPTA